MSREVWCRRVLLALVLPVLSCCPLRCQSADGAVPVSSDSALYLKVQLSRPSKFSKMKPGDVVDGSLTRDLYSGEQKLFPAGSAVRLTVDHVEKRKREWNDHWPWIVQVFTPRHVRYPVFSNASIVQQQKDDYPLHVSLLSASATREIRAQNGHREHHAASAIHAREKKDATPTLTFRADDANRLPAVSFSDGMSETQSPETISIPAGTHCKLLLLTAVSASKSRPGDVVSARLLEPLFLNEVQVLPAGTVFAGRVLKRTPPRRLSRAGSLNITFNEVTLLHGLRVPIAASLAGAELDQRSHTRMDAEGRLHGERPGKAWMAINLGVSAGISKEVDDGVQLLIEALISTATDVSTAGAARIVSGCASGIYMATRHGRDVVLPAFTEIEVSLDRAVSLNPNPDAQVALASRATAN